MADPFDDLAKRAANLSREEKLAAFKAIKRSGGLLPDNLWKATTDEEIRKGLDRIRLARRVRPGVWVGVLAGAIIASKFDIPVADDAYAIGALAAVLLMEVLLMSLPCPRCGFKFMTARNTLTRTCCGCGLSLDQGLRKFFW